MASHVVNLVVFSALVSLVLAFLQRRDQQSRVRYGLLAFCAFVASALVVGWLMYPFPS